MIEFDPKSLTSLALYKGYFKGTQIFYHFVGYESIRIPMIIIKILNLLPFSKKSFIVKKILNNVGRELIWQED